MMVTEQSTPNLRKVGNAKFDTSRNDLFWSYHHYTDALVWLKLDWYGYNDRNWWDNVAPTEEARAKVGQDGKTYLIDFHTCEVTPRNSTMNVDSEKSDGFACMVCHHWTYINETEWEHMESPNGKPMFMHGRSPFAHCPNCGAEILSPTEWAERFPFDQGKTLREIARRYREVDA